MADPAVPPANLLDNIGRIALFGGVILGLVGVGAIAWTISQKVRYADERVAAANAKADKAIRDTELLGRKNLSLSIRLQEEMAAPPATESKRAMLVDALNAIAPKPSIYLQRIVGDAETRTFGDELVASFSDSRISISDAPIEMAAGFPEGLTIIGPEPPEQNKLANAFRRAGFTPTILQGALPKGFSGRVIIGLKPPSF